MYHGSSYSSSSSPGPSQDTRQPFSHSHSTSSFTVAGMNAQGSGSPSLRSSSLGGGPFSMGMGGSIGMGPPLSDSMSQSRSHYQSGYLISAQQNNVLPQGSQRLEEAPMVPTKAKLNQVFSGSTASDFGMDSMFESSRQRHRRTLADEDAPPTASVHDLMNSIYDSGPSRPRSTAFDVSAGRTSLFRSPQSAASKPVPIPTSQSPPLYVIVFGYPPDKFSVTAEYFRSLGETTPPEPSTELTNCFRIGFVHPVEAMRAVRKNGEILSGAWMVGVKWAEPAQAEAILGAQAQVPHTPEGSPERATPLSASPPSGMLFAGVEQPQAPAVGTPIRLAPSAAAYRKPSAGSPQKARPSANVMNLNAVQPGVAPSPTKGMLEQVSDLIFGW